MHMTFVNLAGTEFVLEFLGFGSVPATRRGRILSQFHLRSWYMETIIGVVRGYDSIRSQVVGVRLSCW